MSLYLSADLLSDAYEPNVATQMMSGKAIARALRGIFLIDLALSTELVTAFLPTEEDSTLTDIHESVSNEGNIKVETLSENLDKAMDTDEKQTLLGINQGKYLERLTSHVMNQKKSHQMPLQNRRNLSDTKKALILIFSEFDQKSEFSYHPSAKRCKPALHSTNVSIGTNSA